MNISSLAMQALIRFHDKIREYMHKDNESWSSEKAYGVRSFNDW